ncbi:MAG: hypothetical protein LBI27_01380 [Clostridiales bacterium]|jgi:hypothetical protein|nr:hypothetical protein [Clostridiales bacterium]
MFIKHLKHDLLFGRTMFIAMFVFIIVGAIVGRIAFHMAADEYQARSVLDVSVMGSLALILGFLAVHISQFVEKSMFGDSGYLAFTLPVSRGRLLFSKLLTAWVWFDFIIIAIFIALLILEGTYSVEIFREIRVPRVSLDLIPLYLSIAVIFFFSVSVTFFGLTLHNSVFGKWKCPGFFTSTICLGTIFGYSVTAIRLLNRSQILGPNGGEVELGLHVGRIPIFGSYFDLYIAALGLAIGFIAYFATWYLLKKRVSLQ